MKALVLAGGIGSRLRPLSHSMPKQLVPVANKPVLFHCFETLREVGITEVGLIVSAPGNQIRNIVDDGSRFGLDITYIPQDEPRGLAHCVVIARDFLAEEDFAMFLGDNLFVGGIGPGLAEFRECRPAAQLVVAKVTNPSQYGVVTLDAAGKVVGLEEKPAAPRSDLAITGVYFFTPEIHEAVASIRPSWRNEWEITDAVQWLLEHGRTVRAHAFPGSWYDTGTVADLLNCNQVLLENLEPGVHGVVDTLTKVSGPVLIEPGARVERSRIVGPVIVGAGCTVEDSYIGPFTSIGSGCRLVHASVESSILLDRVTVSHIRFIRDSLIGHSAEITRCGTTPAHRLVVGDDCKMEILA